MAARIDSVARYICDKGSWRVTNLQLQKIIYMAQMFHLGKDGSRLVDAGFEAWDFGPVVPELYRRVRMYGSAPIQDVFYNARVFNDTDTRAQTLEEVCSALLPKRPGELVDITHWEKGAWAKNYVPGIKGIRIPDEDIVWEYNNRLAA